MADNFFKKYITGPFINRLGERKLKKHFPEKPVFIVGCGRSGTTVLLSILSAHPHIYALPHESTAFARWEEVNDHWYPKRLDRFYRYILWNSIPKTAHRFCEKTPNNVRALDKILDYFHQEVLIIHLIRDGRDVMLSSHPDKPQQYWVSPERWVNDVRYGLAYQSYPNVSTIFYEDLIRDFGATIQGICQFIDEPCTEEVYRWFDNASVRQDRAFGGKVRQLHAQSIRKWQRSPDQQRLKQVMQNPDVVDLLKELGYPLDDPNSF